MTPSDTSRITPPIRGAATHMRYMTAQVLSHHHAHDSTSHTNVSCHTNETHSQARKQSDKKGNKAAREVSDKNNKVTRKVSDKASK